MVSGETFFIRVHAAEALIDNGYSEGIEKIFISLQKESPDYIIGSSRVLAKLNKDNPAKFRLYIRQILNRFTASDSINIRLGALESFGKLGYYFTGPQICRFAKEGEKGMKAMARWIISNSGKKEDEFALARLLLSKEPALLIEAHLGCFKELAVKIWPCFIHFIHYSGFYFHAIYYRSVYSYRIRHLNLRPLKFIV